PCDILPTCTRTVTRLRRRPSPMKQKIFHHPPASSVTTPAGSASCNRAPSAGRCKMALFKVGDHVERVGPLVPGYMKFGHIVRIISHPDLPDYLTEYEVVFESQLDLTHRVATLYQTQLRLIVDDPSVWS